MNERSRELQERLRARFDQKMAVGQVCACPYAVAFEEIGERIEGTEDLVYRVTQELASRGLRVANVNRLNENMIPDEFGAVGDRYLGSGSVCTVLASETKAVAIHRSSLSATTNDLIGMIGEDFDVAIVERAAFMTIPKILITKKPQEGFNIGLPNIEAYIAPQDMHNLLTWLSPDDVAGIADFIIQRYAKRKPEEIARVAEAQKVALEAPAIIGRPETLGAGYLRGELSLSAQSAVSSDEIAAHRAVLHPVSVRASCEDQPSESTAIIEEA